MIDFPNAKINLGLRVLDKRPDGYHNISTVMYPVKELADVLEIIEAPGPVFECTGPYSQGLAGDNLCTRAYALLKQDFDIPPVHMYLYKNIPVGAGLGGGSADAAFALKMINVIFSLSLTDEKLEAYAARLGSDCPFFIRNVPAHAAGRGEILRTINMDLSAYKIEIQVPDCRVNTAEAYGMLAADRLSNAPPAGYADDVVSVLEGGIETWNARLINDFEGPVFKKYPDIEVLKKEMIQAGCLYGAMSGSGSAVYCVKATN